MQYRSFGKTGEEVSALGFGTMRLPLKDGSPANIDEREAVRMLRQAIDAGLNYVDTAYMYHDGMSESLVGKALRDGYRQKTYIATKSPVWMLEQPSDFECILEEQLSRLETDVIDFYLLHSMSRKTWEEIALPFELIPRIERARAQGKIRHIGFSFHDEFEAFRTIVDGYDGWEFCQIQLNYIDVAHQAGLQGLAYAAARGLGVVIMEPLLGGKLAAPPESVRRILPPERTPVEWALDFLWDRPEVGPILSGMSTMQQVEDNLAFASRSRAGMLEDEQRRLFEQARVAYETMALVPCTKCAYCMPCPFGVDIPRIFEAYNRTASVSLEEARTQYQALEGLADLCRQCGKCQRVCPQQIAIPELMPQIHAAFAPGEEGVR